MFNIFIKLNSSVRRFPKYSIRLYSAYFQNNYSENQSTQILKIVNNDDLEKISRFDISKARINKIYSWKAKHGPFMSVEQILEVDGFGIKVLEKFCESILNNNEKTKAIEEKSKKTQVLTTPKLLEKRRATLTSCLSLHIGIRNISWCRFSLNDEKGIDVTHWNHYDIDDKKLHLSDLVQLVLYMNTFIPYADIYIIENPKVAQSGGGAPKSILQVNINLQKSQLIAMISLILANRKSNDINISELENEHDLLPLEHEHEQQTVLYLRQYLSSRLFGTFIGNEKVSSETVVEKLINQNSDKVETEPKLTVISSLRNKFVESSNIEREHLGQSFLLGLAFLHLCVLKCQNSLVKVSNSLR